MSGTNDALATRGRQVTPLLIGIYLCVVFFKYSTLDELYLKKIERNPDLKFVLDFVSDFASNKMNLFSRQL